MAWGFACNSLHTYYFWSFFFENCSKLNDLSFTVEFDKIFSLAGPLLQV
jgi:hypothetical protein